MHQCLSTDRCLKTASCLTINHHQRVHRTASHTDTEVSRIECMPHGTTPGTLHDSTPCTPRDEMVLPTTRVEGHVTHQHCTIANGTLEWTGIRRALKGCNGTVCTQAFILSPKILNHMHITSDCSCHRHMPQISPRLHATAHQQGAPPEAKRFRTSSSQIQLQPMCNGTGATSTKRNHLL